MGKGVRAIEVGGKKGRTLTFRVSEEELRWIESRARYYGVTVGASLRATMRWVRDEDRAMWDEWQAKEAKDAIDAGGAAGGGEDAAGSGAVDGPGGKGARQGLSDVGAKRGADEPVGTREHGGESASDKGGGAEEVGDGGVAAPVTGWWELMEEDGPD